MTEGALVALAQAGSPQAFDALYDRYRSPIQNYLYRQCADWQLAQDLTQETFLRAWLAIGHTGDDLRRKVGPWLYRIATNRYLDHYRHAAVLRFETWDAYLSVFHPSQVAAAREQPERLAVAREDTEELRALLDTLPARSRAALLLREGAGLSNTELAGLLGRSRAAVKSLLFRARAELRAAYLRAERQPGRAAGDPPPARRRPHRPPPGAGEGPALARWRAALGLSQRALAGRSGVDRHELSRLELDDKASARVRAQVRAALEAATEAAAEAMTDTTTDTTTERGGRTPAPAIGHEGAGT